MKISPQITQITQINTDYKKYKKISVISVICGPLFFHTSPGEVDGLISDCPQKVCAIVWWGGGVARLTAT
jgi:hypothetical protein